MKFRLHVLVILFPALAAFAQDEMPVDRTFTGEHIPTGAAFYGSAGKFRYQVENGESNNAVADIQGRFNVDFNTADDLLVLLVEAALAIDADASAIYSALACLDGDPFEIMAQLYDVHEDVGLIHYERFKKRLDEAMAGKIDDWIAERKRHMVYGRIDNEAVYRKNGWDVSRARAELDELCHSLR